MSLYSAARNVLQSLSVSVPLTLIFFENVAYVARVEGVSMQPTLNDFGQESPRSHPEVPQSAFKRYLFGFNSSDLILLSHWATRNYQIKRGDVVSLISPKNPNQVIIKRVVALEGDIVVARANNFERIKVPKGHCWVEGDNSPKSMDSNTFGFVPVGLITARAKCVIWPPQRCKTLETKMPSDRMASLISMSPFNGTYNSGHQFLIELKNTPCHFDLRSFEDISQID